MTEKNIGEHYVLTNLVKKYKECNMGMCKKCNKVFPATEMKDGLCPNCYTPENVKQVQQENITVVNNYKLATIISIIATVLGVILVLVGIFELVMVMTQYMAQMQKVIVLAGSVFTLIGGMILILTGQVAKATTDNANYSKAIFDLLKDKMNK